MEKSLGLTIPWEQLGAADDTECARIYRYTGHFEDSMPMLKGAPEVSFAIACLRLVGPYQMPCSS